MNLEIYKSAIYKVNTSSGSGTGFFIKDKNFLITNYHVVAGNKEISIEDENQDRYLGKVVYINPKIDVAFVIAEGLEGRASSSIAIDGMLSINERDKLYVLGYPFGMPFSITEGIVSSPDQLMGGSKYVQTDAAVNPGNSGGPMLDEKGNLIAMTTCKFTEADNVGFGIPYKSIETEISTYEKGSNPEKYGLACHSCHALTYEATEYCNSCGAKLDKTLFDETILEPLAIFVEDALSKLGMNPVLARTGKDYWNFHHGSSLIRIFVYEGNYLFATSPLNELPAQNQGNLYEYILTDPISPYKLGISDNNVYIAYRVHLNDIFSDKQEKIKEELSQLAIKADEMDDLFFEKFQCPMTEYSKKGLRRE